MEKFESVLHEPRHQQQPKATLWTPFSLSRPSSIVQPFLTFLHKQMFGPVENWTFPCRSGGWVLNLSWKLPLHEEVAQ